ncbi:MAG: hypothetical protein R3E86_10955 [Pseudomonadales bacterium]
MSILWTLLLYLALLPLVTAAIGALFGLLDLEHKAAALGRMGWRLLPLLVIAAAAPTATSGPLSAAVASVLFGYVIVGSTLRWLVRRGWLTMQADP